jgi:hypothetical protein
MEILAPPFAWNAEAVEAEAALGRSGHVLRRGAQR